MRDCIEALALGGAYGPETADTLVTNQSLYIMRDVDLQHVRDAVGVPAQDAVGVLGENTVSVRALDFFSSQKKHIV